MQKWWLIISFLLANLHIKLDVIRMAFDHVLGFLLKSNVQFVGLTCSLTICSVVQSPGSKRSEALLEPKETVVLTPKNVQVFVVCRACSIYCKLSHILLLKGQFYFTICGIWTAYDVIINASISQALRTLFNISHRLHNVLGPSWSLVS